jgi:hypothetical protein
MESEMYMEGAGQQSPNKRGAKDLRDGERDDKIGGKVCGTPPRMAEPEWKAIPSS